ncbi:unnamed protein product [Effrenium voratum]|uniref:Pentatricopeptide repeat-containing protein, chloroplastic n=1 Tax=Effrenium voratum TaxID=2562239 RepID=A0AA36JQW1_9DINO|nr:unnamed protein product [Effrenium voratum]
MAGLGAAPSVSQASLSRAEHYAAEAASFAFNGQLRKCQRAAQWRDALLLLRGHGTVRPDVVSFNTVAACRMGWRRVLRVLGSAPKPDVVSFNTAISCSWHNDLLLADMAWHGVLPNAVTLNTALRQTRRWRSALLFCDAAQWRRLRRDAITASSCAKACAERWQVADEVLLRMRLCDLPTICIRTGSWRRSLDRESAIYESCKASSWRPALALLRRCGCLRAQVAAMSFGALAKSSWRQGLLLRQALDDLAWNAWLSDAHWTQALQHLVLSPKKDIVALSSAMGVSGRAAQWLHALALGDTPGGKLRRDAGFFNARLMALTTGQQWHRCLHLFQRLPTASLSAAGAANEAMINAGFWRRALNFASQVAMRLPARGLVFSSLPAEQRLSAFQDDLRHGLELDTTCLNLALSVAPWPTACFLLASDDGLRDVVSYGAALGACAQAGMWQQALLLLEDMAKAEVTPNDICYNSAIAALSAVGLWQQALLLLRGASRPGYGAAIAACAQGVQWQRALLLLAVMEQASFEPNLLACSSGIAACAQGGEWQLALAMLQSLTRADLVAYSSALSACEWQRAGALLAGLQKLTPNEHSYTATVAACERACRSREPTKNVGLRGGSRSERDKSPADAI